MLSKPSPGSLGGKSASVQRPVRIIGWRRLGWLLGVAALALLQACSAVKLAYDNSPEFGYWWLDAYVDFNDAQSTKVREELARLQQWHRANELPKIADLLQKTQQLAMADASPASACNLYADSRQRFNAVTSQVENAAVVLAMSLSAEQIAKIERKFGKGDEEWQRDWLKLSAAERLDKRVKSNVERAEEFYGQLDDRQVAALRAALQSSTFDPGLSFTERQRRQQDLISTLRQVSGKSSADALPALRAWLERASQSPNPAYRAYSDKQTQESCASFSQLHNSTTPEQRARAVRRLAAYERDARELGRLR